MKFYSVDVVPTDSKFYEGKSAGIFSTKEKEEAIANKIEQNEKVRYCVVGEVEVDKEE